MEQLLSTDVVSDAAKAAIGAMLIGLVFGYFSQRSQFCFRAATIEMWRGKPGGKLAVWLAAFGVALVSVQLLVEFEILPVDNIRQLAQSGSFSGALIGGAMFGVGMILARGCAARILVLSATGNLRTLMTGLLLTVVAQSSLRGILSPVREELSGLWIIEPDVRDLSLFLPEHAGLVIGLGVLILAAFLVRKSSIGIYKPLGAAVVGLTIASGWYFTSTLSLVSFDPVDVQSITFTGPSADTLMALINEPRIPFSFGIGLVPGVFIGSFIAAVGSGTFRIQGFSVETGTVRYFVGATLMGFGGMLAGGCAVGAGLTGVSVLSLTALAALGAMWLFAGITDMLVDRENSKLAMTLSTGRRLKI